jgi:hypothetical protein
MAAAAAPPDLEGLERVLVDKLGRDRKEDDRTAVALAKECGLPRKAINQCLYDHTELFVHRMRDGKTKPTWWLVDADPSACPPDVANAAIPRVKFNLTQLPRMTSGELDAAADPEASGVVAAHPAAQPLLRSMVEWFDEQLIEPADKIIYTGEKVKRFFLLVSSVNQIMECTLEAYLVAHWGAINQIPAIILISEK